MPPRLLLSLLLALAATSSACRQAAHGGSADAHGTAPAAHGTDESDLLLQMLFLQRYAEKAYLAAEAANWPLASFYAHEIEETAERLAGGGYDHDGVALAPLAREGALPAAERLHAAAEASDGAAFADAFAGLVASCNACHARTGHPHIAVQVPEGRAAYPSQRFAP